MIREEATIWQNMLEPPFLDSSEIHVWRINLNKASNAEINLKNYLSDEESNRAGYFYFIKDQNRFVIRRAALRYLLGSYLKKDIKTIQLLSKPNGKPYINGQEGQEGICFNCSHSSDWGLIAFARGRELGADIEYHRPLIDAMELAHSFFSSQEIAGLMKIPESLVIQCFYDAWTQKEAFVKAIGLGLSFPLSNVSVSLAPDQPAKLVKVDNLPQALDRWNLMRLSVSPDYSAALVHEDLNATVKYFEWES